MSDHANSPVAHQFDDMAQQKEAVTLGMWAFLITEVMFFGGLLGAYTVYRHLYYEGFVAASHDLDIVLGGINTAVLILSSLTMAMAVHSAQLDNRKKLIWFLILTVVLGGVFLGIKAVEYSHKFHSHHVPGALFDFPPPHTNSAEIFFSLYFAMTGLHALHMVIGIGIMLVILGMAMRRRFSPEYYAPVEMVGLYWHFVDIVWIFLFPLLYLVGRH